jgi:hypothetical protein
VNLPKDQFNKEWRLSSKIRRVSISDVNNFIVAHYLRKRPAIVLLCLLLLVEESPVGCIVYSAPPREANKRYGGETWELARVYIIDSIPRNAETYFIAQSVKYIRKHFPHVRHLLSYADPSAGHYRIIYRAGNWLSDGKTDQERKTPRSDYVDIRTGKKYGRRGNIPPGATVARIPRVSKYRFHYIL